MNAPIIDPADPEGADLDAVATALLTLLPHLELVVLMAKAAESPAGVDADGSLLVDRVGEVHCLNRCDCEPCRAGFAHVLRDLADELEQR